MAIDGNRGARGGAAIQWAAAADHVTPEAPA
jgi:hypothetical protein